MKRLEIMTVVAALLTGLVIGLGACGTPAPYRDEPVVWEDDDRHPITRPEENEATMIWNAADHTAFRPITRALLIDTFGPAKNVNALGEVPNSSWFSNRMSLKQLSVERVAEGPCEKPLDPHAQWKIHSGKLGGFNPGFMVENTNDGSRYVLKFAGRKQPERASAADVIGSRVYWAAGYSTPCNSVVFIDIDNLVLGEDATQGDEIGREIPITRADVEKSTERAPRDEDGRIRAMASLFLPGEPLGPFKYHGTRADDPNDVIPHEDRRELRGMKLLAAWINHFDSREQNTFTSFIEGDDGRGYVQHHMLDFGDSLGSEWPSDAMTRRFGHSFYFDIKDVLIDWVTLGSFVRPWQRAEKQPDVGNVFGYFDAANFEPEDWKPGYPNPAFARMDDLDAFWAAKIISRFSDRHIQRLVEISQFSDPAHARYLESVLRARRDKIVHRYLRRHSAFASPRLDGSRLCVEDLLVRGGYVGVEDSYYEAWVTDGWTRDVAARPDGVVCVVVPDTVSQASLRVRRVDQREPARPTRVVLGGTSGDRQIIGLDR